MRDSLYYKGVLAKFVDNRSAVDDEFQLTWNLGKNNIYEVFSDCMDYPISSKQLDLVNRVESLLQSNYQNPDLSVQDVSLALHFESSYIRRIYKTHTDKTIIQRLEVIRIEKACDLLVNTEMKLSETAEKVGYSNQFYFSRRFKLFTSLSPSEYRERYMSHS